MDTCDNSRADTCIQTDLLCVVLIRCPHLRTSVVFLMIHGKSLTALSEGSFKFLTYQLSMVGYWPTTAVTGKGERVSDSGVGA